MWGASPRGERDAIKEEADRCGMPYMTQRWLGGTLTNFATVKKSVSRLKELEALIDALPATIARHDATLADPDLYSRDPKAFDAAMKAAEKARVDLESAEMEWLELEEKKAALAG